MNFPPGGHASGKMPAPQRCPHCLRLVVDQAYHEEERRVREGDEVGEGSPHGAPGIWPHALWARPWATRTVPLPSPGSLLWQPRSSRRTSSHRSPRPAAFSSKQPLPLSASLHFQVAPRTPSRDPSPHLRPAPALSRSALTTALGGLLQPDPGAHLLAADLGSRLSFQTPD